MWAVTHFEKACVATWANIWMMVYFSKRIDWEWLYFHVFVWHRRRLCFKTKSQNILLKHCFAFQRHWWGKCLILGFNLGFDKNHFKASWWGWAENSQWLDLDSSLNKLTCSTICISCTSFHTAWSSTESCSQTEYVNWSTYWKWQFQSLTVTEMLAAAFCSHN